MTRLKAQTLYIFILLFLPLYIYGGNPHIINLTKDIYKADNKNWSIDQDERGILYVGNDVGLLEFDGIEWNLNPLPHDLMVRSVAALSHETIFTGSYEEFG